MTDEYRFSADLIDIDRERVHAWLSEQSYWAAGRAREVQDAAIDASRNYAVVDGDGRQVAYARVVTDAVTFAWLCDVFVDQDERGHGIGKLLIEGVVADIERMSVTRILLATADAHGLYAQYGFAPSEDPTRYMIRPMV
ncbi:GNAT family N-acetyltransferase [Microbacterium sp. Mu-80]|uniref:GNAT family N-acetyltransferase n=1 Tax=Microbacterium bandirmense TaxID=3122050 RepID=A0ABU8L8A1_9MICO